MMPLLLVVMAASLAESEAVAHIQTLLQTGKPEQALTEIGKLDGAARNQPLLKHLAGLALYQKGDYEQAIEYLTASFAQTPKGVARRLQAAHLLGMSHYFLGHVSEALPFLTEIEGSSFDTSETQYLRGVCQLQLHRVDDSRKTFARMFSLPAESAASHLINAQMMIRQQLEELAVPELEKALALDPKLPQAHFLLGEMAIYKAHIDRGIQLLQKEIALNPGFAMAYYRLGEAYTRQLKWDEAVSPLQKSIWLNPFFSGPFIVLGKVYLKKGDLENAESMLKRALAMDVNNYSGHHLLAQVYQKAGRHEESRKELQTAERLRSNSQP
ncbi:MAG: tetratricopeptide repeat protein [Acidobacteriota bacterium]